MLFSTCANDDAFGPGVVGCRDDFDFTIRFEQIFFSLLPSILFTLSSICRAILLARMPVVVNAPMLQVVKSGAITMYVGLQLSLVVIVSLGSFEITALSIASTILQFVAALCMVALSFLDHSRSPRPSVLLSAYLFITTLFDVAQARTFWLASSTKFEVAYAGVFTTCMTLKIAILFLEARQKAAWVNWDAKQHSPEETSGLYSLGVYFWLNNLFLSGYKKILRISDLYPLDSTMSGDILQKRFLKHADYNEFKTDQYALPKTLAKTLKVQLLLPIAPKLCVIAFTFCQPFFIHALLEHLSQPSTTSAAKNAAYGFIGASICIYSGMAISEAFFSYFHHRMLAMARGCLVAAIYAKATDVQIGAGEDNATVTLMSSDIERIEFGFVGLHNIWASLIEVGVASWLLYELLGPVFVAPIVVVLCCIVAISILARYTGPAQTKWMEAVQKRVGLTGTVIASMKSLKLSGLAEPISIYVQKLRDDEIRAGGRSRLFIIVAAIIGFTPLILSPVMTFAFAQRNLNAAVIFTALSYLLLLSSPLLALFQAVPQIISGMACLARIQAFLASTVREDYRTVAASTAGYSEKSSEASVPCSEKGFTDPAIIVQHGNFGWIPGRLVLQDINVKIPRSALTIVVGPIASGKSTFTKALLGEVPVSRGNVQLKTRQSRVGFCDQVAFLSDGSVRDNIIGFSAFDPHRYAEVIDATMLGVDLETLPLGDMSNIGSNGITLSGGQRQRVSLARALYLHADLLVLDDVFSGLDADTEDQVFKKVFGPQGLIRRRGATALLCTHSVRHLPWADHVVALAQNGTVAEQGSFDDLMQNNGYVQSLDVKSSDSSSEEIEDRSPAQKSYLELTKKTTNATGAPTTTDAARQVGDRKVYKHYIRSSKYKLCGQSQLKHIDIGFSVGYDVAIMSMVTAAGLGGLHSFATAWLKFWSDDASSQTPSRPHGFYVGIYALLEVSALLSLLALGWYIFVLSVARSGSRLHQLALTTLVHAPLKLFTVTDQGAILNMFSQDLNLVDMALPNALCNTLLSAAIALGAAVILVTSSPYMAVSYPFLAVLMWVVQRFYLRTSRQLRLLDLEAKSPLYTHFLDTTKGIVTLRAFGFINEDKAKNIALLNTSQRPAYLLTMIQQWLLVVLKLVVAVLAAILTALAVNLRSNSGFTGASLITLMSFGDQLSEIVRNYTQLETSIGAIARLRAFHETVKPEDREGEVTFPPEEWPVQGKIELKGVSASYADEMEDAKEPLPLALRDINFTITGGEKVAICGRTGSGKSSLVALILKLLDPVSSTPDNVFIDGVSLSTIDRQTLRTRVLAVPQDAVFLPDGSSFQENLDPFNLASVAQCQAVLKTIGLSTFVQERGGLEASRVVLRRRLRAKSLGLGGGGTEGGLLVLDEMSSSVDLETERTMQEIIRVEFEKYTILAVSHRLDMIADFDKVVVMDRGQIVEAGNPRQLVQDPNSRFGDLWRTGGN
ncbi:putative ABC multidrug transporter [Paramyrothecium foliicola]|nr:putative ABC multidrug transporter [Paramyrothecium foliicola]